MGMHEEYLPSHRQEVSRMKKLLLSVSLAGLLLTCAAVAVHPVLAQTALGQQSTADTKMVTGKVTAIGNSGRSFALAVTKDGDSQTMQFTLGAESKVEGKVSVGTSVVVEYRAMEGGQNIALTITAQA
jgi:hypothetical protein